MLPINNHFNIPFSKPLCNKAVFSLNFLVSQYSFKLVNKFIFLMQLKQDCL